MEVTSNSLGTSYDRNSSSTKRIQQCDSLVLRQGRRGVLVESASSDTYWQPYERSDTLGLWQTSNKPSRAHNHLVCRDRGSGKERGVHDRDHRVASSEEQR